MWRHHTNVISTSVGNIWLYFSVSLKILPREVDQTPARKKTISNTPRIECLVFPAPLLRRISLPPSRSMALLEGRQRARPTTYQISLHHNRIREHKTPLFQRRLRKHKHRSVANNISPLKDFVLCRCIVRAIRNNSSCPLLVKYIKLSVIVLAFPRNINLCLKLRSSVAAIGSGSGFTEARSSVLCWYVTPSWRSVLASLGMYPSQPERR